MNINDIETFLDRINLDTIRNDTKKKKIRFGRKISIFIILTTAFSLIAGAAVVNYLSNSVTTEIEVESPVEIFVGDPDELTDYEEWVTGYDVPTSGWDADGTITLSPGYGGTTKTFWVKVENKADGAVTSNLVFKVRCSTGLQNDGTEEEPEIADFSGVAATVYDWDNTGPTKRVVSIPDVFDSSYLEDKMVSNKLRVWYPDTYLFASGTPGDTYYVEIDITFAGGAYGTYYIDAAWLDDPEGAFP